MRKYLWLLMVALLFIIAWHFTVPAGVMNYEASKLSKKLVSSMPLITGSIAVLSFGENNLSDNQKEQAAVAIEKGLLARFHTIKLVDRRHLSDILREQKFQLSPYSENSEVVKVGQIAKATHLLLINLSKWQFEDKKAKLNGNIRLLDVEKGTILWVQNFAIEHYPLLLRILGWLIVVIFVSIFVSWIFKYELKEKTRRTLKETKEKIIDTEGIIKSILRKIEEIRNNAVKLNKIEQAKSIREFEKRVDQILNRIKGLPHGSVNWTLYENAKGAKGQAERFERTATFLDEALLETIKNNDDWEKNLKRIDENLIALEQMIDDYFQFIR